VLFSTGYRFIFFTGTRRKLHGIPVSVFEDQAVAESVFPRISDALYLIRTYDSRRFRRLKVDVPRILVQGQETTRNAWCHARLRWCVVTFRYATAADTSLGDLASSIVHEATHARIAHAGIEYRMPTRARIELACAKEQLAFARRLPDSDELVAQLTRRVASWACEPGPDWSDERFRRDAAQALRDNQAPAWLVRLLGMFARRAA
jgi:hypothetical protein